MQHISGQNLTRLSPKIISENVVKSTVANRNTHRPCSLSGFCPGRALVQFELKNSRWRKENQRDGPEGVLNFLNKRQRNQTSAMQFGHFS